MTGDNSAQRAEQLRDGLRQEREIYQVLAELTHRQGKILSEGRTEEILQLARTKEHELARIEEIEVHLAPLKKNWPEFRERVSDSLRTQVEKELAAIEEVLRELIDRETEGQSEFEQKRKHTAEQLRKLEGGRRMSQAYGAGAPQKTRFLDHSH